MESNDDVLDCTMGLGADSIVSSYVVNQGKVVCLESQWMIYWVVKEGLSLYNSDLKQMDQAMRRLM